MRLSVGLLTISLLFSGCYFYSDDHGKCPKNQWEAADWVGLRNPATGTCDGPSVDRCGQPEPFAETWAYCYDSCSDLELDQCVATEGCRAIFANDESNDGGPQYSQCWGTDRGPYVATGACEDLDALDCSTRDDCMAYHWTTGPDAYDQPADFWRCAAENDVVPGCFGNDDCSIGYR
jgi:hypothetical protein